MHVSMLYDWLAPLASFRMMLILFFGPTIVVLSLVFASSADALPPPPPPRHQPAESLLLIADKLSDSAIALFPLSLSLSLIASLLDCLFAI
jgi:hypothetical protein